VLNELVLDELNQLRRRHGIEFDALIAQKLYFGLRRPVPS
jgi:hypothetical protein